MTKHHAITCLRLELCFKLIRTQSSSFSTLTSSSKALSNTPFLSARKLKYIRQEFAHLLQLPNFSQNPILYYKRIHAQFIVSGIGYDVFLGNILMHLYSKMGKIWYAQKVFDEMPKRNLVSWSTMVTNYVQNGYVEEGLMVFSELRRSCEENPNEYVLASVMRACVQVGCLVYGKQVHGFVVKSGLSENVYVGTSLTDFYAKLGDIDDARMIFDGLKEKSLFSWAVMIMGYVKSGGSDVSLMLFRRMMNESNVVPDRYVVSSVINACSILHDFEGGRQIHAYVLRRRVGLDVSSVINALLDFYVKCGRVISGRKLFDLIDAKDVISWTTIIAGYMQNSFHVDAIKLFHEMSRFDWKLDDFLCSSILNSCGSLEALLQGKQVHSYVIKANLECDEYVRNGLIDMYSKCNSLADARMVFESMSQCNVISYNAMIEGYSSLGKITEALDLFHDMRIKLIHPNLLTYVSILGASASLSFVELSKQIHGIIIKVGVSSDLFASSALIDVYCKCNFLKDAELVFNEISEKDVVVWNALLFGYTQQLENEDALNVFNQFQLAGHKANEFTFVAMLTAASNLASLRHGQQFHNLLIKTGLDTDAFVTNSLLDMYAKCGCLQDSFKLFNTTTCRDIACWNSMISTYANHGVAEEALSLYEQMLQDGLLPNNVTFIGLLSACSHAGLVEDGLKYFNTMLSYGIEPGMEHYACMVSLFGRAGKLNDAKKFIEKMPIKPAALVWRSLLSACRAMGDYDLGAYAAEMAISSDPGDSGSYILLSNIYASQGMWNEVKETRERMNSNLVVKEPGRSWIEINDEVNVFISRDTSHWSTDVIFSVLDNLIKEMKGLDLIDENAPILVDD